MRYVIRERFFHFGEDSDILDDMGNPVIHVDGKVLSLHNTLILRDLQGNELARVERKLISLRPTYEIAIQGHPAAEVRKQFFTPFREKYTIDIPGPDDLELAGDFLDHEFTVSQRGQLVATVSKRWFTVRETFGVETAPGVNDLLILASVLALDLAEDRAEERERGEG